jgi:hypothetical protein
MYSTCLFCNGQLGANETVEHFPVGKRLAFDARRGRLWAVCPRCHRWNLTPIEERWEAIEECERIYRGTLTRVATDNVGLAAHRSGLDLVRIGEPLRPEFAAWRYARHFRARRRWGFAMKGAALAGAGAALVGGAAAALSTGPLLLIAGPVIVPATAAIPVIGIMLAQDYVANDRIVARFKTSGKRFGFTRRFANVRAHHVSGVHLATDGGNATLVVPHDGGQLRFEGTDAIHATTVILANSNRSAGGEAIVENAVKEIEQAGSVEQYLAAAAHRGERRRDRMVSALGSYRSLGALNLTRTEQVALEMAVHEESERRAMDGELDQLEDAWRDAEEIAAICDRELTP